MRAAVGRFHDAGATACADEQLLVFRTRVAVACDQAGKLTGFVIKVRIADMSLRDFQGVLRGLVTLLRQQVGLSGVQRFLGLLRGRKAGAAKHDDGVFNTLFVLADFWLEHFQLHADTTCFAAQQKFGVCKGKSVGVSVQRVALLGMGLQFRPGVCKSVAR